MILQLRKLQLCLDGSELASSRLEYYKTYRTLCEYSPRKLQQVFDIEEDVEILDKDYHDLFIRPNHRYVFPFSSAHKKRENRPKGPDQPLLKDTEDQKPPDHVLFGLKRMCSLIKKEKRQWQKKNFLVAMNLLHQEQNYLLNHLDWLPELCAKIQKNAISQFYYDVALNLENFFHLEKLFLERILLERVSMMN